MSYKWTTGSVNRGDIYFEDDRDGDKTYIDFGQDTITLRPSGSQILHATSFAVGIGTTSPDPDELLTIDGVGGEHEANIQFREDGANRAKIGVNDSDNLVFHNQTVNKHVVFKVNDQGVTREGLRIDGAVTAVVVNEGAESLVDFRVESDNNTHMLFVDGANDKVGINTDQPDYTLDVAGDIGVDQKIYHNGDANTYINFTDDRIRFDAGGLNLFGMHKKGSSPHQVTVNNGGNNVDFVVNDNSSNTVLRTDASTSRVGISTGTPHSGLQIDNSVAFAARAITQNHTVTEGDHTIFVNATSGNITVTLPSATNIMGRQYVIKRVDSSVNSVTIDPDGSETIEGASTITLDVGRSVVIQSDNSNWWIMAEYISPP
jgi:hypothetical protein